MNPTMESNKSAGNWFSTLTCGANASGTSANQHLIAFTTPSPHTSRPGVKTHFTDRIAVVPWQELLRCNACEGYVPAVLAGYDLADAGCQGENAFPEVFVKMPLTACICRRTHVEKLWKRCSSLGVGAIFRGADQSQPWIKESRSAPALLHGPP